MRISPPITADLLTDESNWAFRAKLSYSPNGTNQTGLRLFPPSLQVPFIRLVTVAAEVPGKYKRPPDHWFLAGNLTIAHGPARDGETYKVPLNAPSYFPLSPVALPYQVGFDAVNWLPSLEVTLYEWSGELLTQTQPPDLSAIEDELAALGLGIEAIARNQALQNQAITQGNLLPGILAPLQADLAASTTSLQLLGTGIL